MDLLSPGPGLSDCKSNSSIKCEELSLKLALGWEELCFVKNLSISNHKNQQQILTRKNTLIKKNLPIYAR